MMRRVRHGAWTTARARPRFDLESMGQTEITVESETTSK
jgi:hypothetical protein